MTLLPANAIQGSMRGCQTGSAVPADLMRRSISGLGWVNGTMAATQVSLRAHRRQRVSAASAPAKRACTDGCAAGATRPEARASSTRGCHSGTVVLNERPTSAQGDRIAQQCTKDSASYHSSTQRSTTQASRPHRAPAIHDRVVNRLNSPGHARIDRGMPLGQRNILKRREQLVDMRVVHRHQSCQPQSFRRTTVSDAIIPRNRM